VARKTTWSKTTIIMLWMMLSLTRGEVSLTDAQHARNVVTHFGQRENGADSSDETLEFVVHYGKSEDQKRNAKGPCQNLGVRCFELVDGIKTKTIEATTPRRRGSVTPSIRETDACLSFGLAFVGGYGGAAGFVLATTFTGHVTGNLVLGAIAVAAHDGRATLGHLSAIAIFLVGVPLSVLVSRSFKARSSAPFLPTVMGIEVIVIVAASLVPVSGVTHGVTIFVIFVSLALGLQNGAFRRVGGISIHTTYLTGMITSLIFTEVGKYASGEASPPMRAPDPQMRVLCGIWAAFVLGAGTGASMVLHFKALGMLGAAPLLIVLILRNTKVAQMTETC
jgi:uncharacterized membrane protein YoaK (UPF0700 family)